MDARKGNIYEILNGNKQFLIPVYQRFYSWDIDQCKRLWNDIVEMQRKSKAGHFVGSIVNIAEQAMPTGVQKYMIIDGQQRMTTLTLLLLALRDYAIKNPGDTTINARRIDNMLLKNEYENGDERYKLLLTETDRDILISLVEEKPIAEGTRSRLIENYNFFANKLADKEIQPAEVYESIGKLQIVNITLDRTVDDAQAIFESLNSTGKELSESDLIRNYVLMGLEPSEQTYVYEHLWRPMEQLFIYETQGSVMDAFFRHYLTMKLSRIPKQGRVYEEFKLYHLNCEFGSIRELCQDLLDYAKYYTNIVFKRNFDTDLKKFYEDIIDLRMEVSYPFLLKIHHDCTEELITSDELKEILKLCISYVLRRAICEIPTNSMNKTFATLKNYIKPDDYLNSVKAFFVMQDTYKEFPDNDKFEGAFVNRDIYNMRARNYILSRLENFENKAPITIENYTIEHIMPQNKNLSLEWQTDLGPEWQEEESPLPFPHIFNQSLDSSHNRRSPSRTRSGRTRSKQSTTRATSGAKPPVATNATGPSSVLVRRAYSPSVMDAKPNRKPWFRLVTVLRPTMGTSACAVSAIRGSCAVRVASAPSEDMTPGQIRPPR